MSGSAPAPVASEGQLASGDLLTVSFADSQAAIYGQGRIAVLPDGRRQTLVAVFAGAQTLAASEVEPGALTLETAAPGRWHARLVGDAKGAGGDVALALDLHASGPAAVVADPQRDGEDTDSAQQPCTVTGSVAAGGRDIAIEGIGQVGLVRGAAGSTQRALWRELDGWLPDGRLITIRASRPAGAGDHGGERVEAVLIAGEPPLAARLDEARVSTIYGADGRQLQAGLELWPTAESDYPRRAAGETLCAASVRAPGGEGEAELRWDCAFLRWHMEGGEGVGPYSIVRSAAR